MEPDGGAIARESGSVPAAVDRLPPADGGPSTGRLRRYAVLLPFVALLAFWTVLTGQTMARGHTLQRGPHAVGYGGDFAMFYSAARVLRAGENPYGANRLYAMESSLFPHKDLVALGSRGLIRVGNPPLFFWLLEPVSHLAFKQVATVWVIVLILLTAAGFLAAASALGWRYRALPLLVFIFMPQVFLGYFYMNPAGLVFAALALSLTLLRRYPFLAGLLMGFAWMKPQIALPIATLLILFQATSWRRTVWGLVAGTCILLGGSLITTGARFMAEWVTALTHYEGSIAVQGDIASLSGIYFHWAPYGVRTLLGLVSLGCAAVLTGVWWWKERRPAGPLPLISTVWLWGVWFLATPYAHFLDQVMLTIPMLVLLGRNGARIATPAAAIALYLAFLSIFPFDLSPKTIQFLWIPAVGITVCLFVARGRTAKEQSSVMQSEISTAS